MVGLGPNRQAGHHCNLNLQDHPHPLLHKGKVMMLEGGTMHLELVFLESEGGAPKVMPLANWKGLSPCSICMHIDSGVDEFF